ncbi:MAG TPA: SGNH/GDSL hydrolase family protein [Bryobacteraceae bacterium]|nr:SGNH/GDSL hydrolase family protein [Bryobacteraceae bacterium]
MPDTTFLIRRAALALLTAAGLFSAVVAQPALRWIPLPDARLEVDGLPWYSENGGDLSRLPVKLKDSFRKPVWDLAQSPSGARIRFRTNSSTLAIRLEYPQPPAMKNMHAFGQTGVDLYIEGVYRGTAIAGPDSKPGLAQEHIYFKAQPRTSRELTLYLPLYMPVKVLGIGVDADATIETANPFALPKPIVFYGTSITQGGCASRSGMSYQAILCRRLNTDFVNLGFSGNGKGEPEMAQAVAGLDASCFVLDFAQNNETVESLKNVYAPFVEAIRAKHPDTPIVVVTPIYSAREAWGRDARLDGMRELIRDVAARRIAAGDRNIQIVEGADLLGPSQGDGLVDGTHPNDLGFEWMADGLARRLSKMLSLKLER